MDTAPQFSGPLTPPAAVVPRTLTVTGPTPRERGWARGRAAAGDIARAIAGYSALFEISEIPLPAQREAVEASLRALGVWDAKQVEELRGVAAGAADAGAEFDGCPVELWHVGLVAVRTEILTLAAEKPAECSTIAFSAPGATLGVQTWDWCAEFADIWHFQQVSPCDDGAGGAASGRAAAEAGEAGAGGAGAGGAGAGGRIAHAGFAEFGMLGKIGLNAAGVGVMLNILKHRDDSAGGVPVHAILNRVLERAHSVDEAVAIIRSAHTTSSSVITVVGPDSAVMVEISPHGTAVLHADSEVVAVDGQPIGPGAPAPQPGRFPPAPGEPDRFSPAPGEPSDRGGASVGGEAGGFLIHTNHFIAPELQDGALPLSAVSRSEERIRLLGERLRGSSPAAGGRAGGVAPTADQLLALMCTGGDDAPICKTADLSLGFGERYATLVTIAIDPNAGTIRMSPGSPHDLLGTEAAGASGAETGEPKEFTVR